MGVSFFEMMRGHLVDRRGVTHEVDFDIKAEATHLRRLLDNGETRITGIMRALPWADDAPLQGTLCISPFRRRRIDYDFVFRDEDELEYHFDGFKVLNPLHPIRSITELTSTLRCGGEVVAEGKLFFDFADLPSFLKSWTPTTAVRALDLDATGADDVLPSAPLGEEGRRVMKAYGEAIIESGELVCAFDERTMQRALQILSRLPSTGRTIYRATLSALDAYAMLRHGRRFASLSRERRSALTRRLAAPNHPAARLSILLGMPIKMAHFGRPEYLDALGLSITAPPVKERRPHWMANVMPPEGLDPETTLPADVVIVGTGAGGAPMAARLAELGLAVAVIEEGRYEGREAFSGPLEDRMHRFWRDGGATMAIGKLPVSIPTGCLVGGTTAINSGTCLEAPDALLESWCRDLGLPDDFAPANFAAHVEAVKAELGVAPAQAQLLGDIAGIVAAGADAMGVRHGPLPRNAPDCDGQGACALGCPTGAKRSTNVSYMPRALRAGAHLFTGLGVTRILTHGDRAVAVEARGQDRHGASRVLRIRARAVVVACGALRSPGLLQDSGIDLPWIGRNLSIHPAMGMLARSSTISAPWDAIPQSYGIEGLLDDRVRFEGFWAAPQLMAAASHMVGAELTGWMDAMGQVGQYGFMVRDRGVGSVHRGPGSRPLIRYDVTSEVLGYLQKGSAALAELLVRGGAEEVLAGLGPIQVVRTVEQAKRIASANLRPRDFRLVGFHPLGTCRLSPSAKLGVVDPEHRVHGMENLYVVDGGAVPTSLGVNPQITIMAMAERAAKILGRQLAP